MFRNLDLRRARVCPPTEGRNNILRQREGAAFNDLAAVALVSENVINYQFLDFARMWVSKKLIAHLNFKMTARNSLSKYLGNVNVLIARPIASGHYCQHASGSLCLLAHQPQDLFQNLSFASLRRLGRLFLRLGP